MSRGVNGVRLRSSVPTPSGWPSSRSLAHVSDDEHVPRGSRDARVLQRCGSPAPRAGRPRLADPGGTNATRARIPRSVSRSRKEPPGLDRVERVFAEDERARGSRRPRIDQRDLDHVERLALAGEPATRLVVHEADARVAVEMAGEVAEPAVHGPDDVVVDLDRRHVRRAERQGRQHVAAAADANHGHPRSRPQVIPGVRDVVLQMFELRSRP